MMARGANNVYDNGRNLLVDRTDTEGPVRKGYQVAAKAVGFEVYTDFQTGKQIYQEAEK